MEPTNDRQNTLLASKMPPAPSGATLHRGSEPAASRTAFLEAFNRHIFDFAEFTFCMAGMLYTIFYLVVFAILLKQHVFLFFKSDTTLDEIFLAFFQIPVDLINHEKFPMVAGAAFSGAVVHLCYMVVNAVVKNIDADSWHIREQARAITHENVRREQQETKEQATQESNQTTDHGTRESHCIDRIPETCIPRSQHRPSTAVLKSQVQHLCQASKEAGGEPAEHIKHNFDREYMARVEAAYERLVADARVYHAKRQSSTTAEKQDDAQDVSLRRIWKLRRPSTAQQTPSSSPIPSDSDQKAFSPSTPDARSAIVAKADEEDPAGDLETIKRPNPLKSAHEEARRIQRRENLRRLALETIDLDHEPYTIMGGIPPGIVECKLCFTQHNDDASFLAHTHGRKHQSLLAKGAAREAKNNSESSAGSFTSPTASAAKGSSSKLPLDANEVQEDPASDFEKIEHPAPPTGQIGGRQALSPVQELLSKQDPLNELKRAYANLVEATRSTAPPSSLDKPGTGTESAKAS